jgi:hypothetical protein
MSRAAPAAQPPLVTDDILESPALSLQQLQVRAPLCFGACLLGGQQAHAARHHAALGSWHDRGCGMRERPVPFPRPQEAFAKAAAAAAQEGEEVAQDEAEQQQQQQQQQQEQQEQEQLDDGRRED